MAAPMQFPGRPGVPWDTDERAQWLASMSPKRSYKDEVLTKLEPLKEQVRARSWACRARHPPPCAQLAAPRGPSH